VGKRADGRQRRIRRILPQKTTRGEMCAEGITPRYAKSKHQDRLIMNGTQLKTLVLKGIANLL
jgi:hypothetical protein